MARQLLCDGCGNAIEDNGWRCHPAILRDGDLVGTEGEGGDAIAVGAPLSLCCDCVVYDHPKGDDADRDDS